MSRHDKKKDYIIALNDVGEIIFCNKSFLNRLNYTYGEILNSNIKNIVIDKDNIINEVDDIDKDLKFLSNTGELVELNVNINKEEFNNKKYILIVGKEINNSENDTVFLSKYISESIYKSSQENDIEGISKIVYNVNETLKILSENILNYTHADAICIYLYDKEKEGLQCVLKSEKSQEYLKYMDFVPLKNYQEFFEQYKRYINTIYTRNKNSNFSPAFYDNIDNVNYCGNYTIQFNDEFLGVVGLVFEKGNRPKINNDEYMRNNCNKMGMIIKNNILINQVVIENKKRRYTEKELESYLNVSVDLVAIVGKDGYLKKISPNWTKVLGWSEEELLSMSVENIVHPEELKIFKSRYRAEDIDKQITRNIIQYRHKKGHYVHLEWNSMYIKEEEIYITTSRDITESIELEREKQLLEKAMKEEVAKNEFFSNISHEFRTPINIILGTMQVINRNIEKNNIDINNLKKHTKYIKQNSYRLLRLTNNLIDISKMDIGSYELRCKNQNIINIIEDITLSVADYMKDNNINLVFDTSHEEVITYCDADKIERIMLNLLSNAIKYTPEDGLIKVEIDCDEKDVIISVKDSGTGIPEDKVDIIFDRFSQVDESLNRKYEGSGIGLSIVRNLVEMHGGNIRVTSKINKGSEFIFNIPIKIDEENNYNEYETSRKDKHVERCDIEFSDIYN